MDESNEENRRHGPPGRRIYDHVTLQYYLERLLREIDRRLDKLDDAITRLDTKQGLYIARDYYDEHHDELEKRLGRVESGFANFQGRGIAVAVLGGIFIAATAGFIGHLLP